jgi:HlyD family secretion protein
MFREKALKKLTSPEQLDQLMQVTSPRRWVALATISALLLCALAWGIWGEVDTDVTGQGLLVKRGGVLSVSALAGGRLLEYSVNVGDKVKVNQVVASISQSDIVNQIRETQAELDGYKAEQDILLTYGKKQLEIELAYKDKQITDAKEKIQRKKSMIKTLSDRQEHQQELLDKGLVSEASLLDTMASRIQADADLADLLSSLTQLQSEIEQKKKEFLQSEAQGAQKITSSEQKLHSLRKDLLEKKEVESRYSGRVLEIMFDPGEVINSGDTILTLEALGPKDNELLALSYFSPSKGKRILKGMKARVSPRSVEADEYGFIEGEVVQVAEFPSTRQGMMRSMHNQDMVDNLIKAGASLEVWIRMHEDPDTLSGYRWTSAKGPPYKITSGTICNSLVTVEEQPPIMLVVPLLKKYILGVQDKLEFSR